MATLENVNGASLVPNFNGGLNMLNQAFGQRMDRQRAQQAQQAQQQQIAQILGGGQGGGQGGAPGATPGFNGNATPEQILRIAQIDPKMAEMMQGMLERNDKVEMEQAKAETDRGVREATLISNAKAPAERMNVLNNLAAAAAAENRPVDRYVELANMTPDQQELELQRMQVMGADLQTLLAPPKPPETREVKRGDRIVTEQFNPQTGQFEQIADAERFNPNSGTTVNVGTGGESAPVVTPPVLLEGLPPEVGAKLDAVYVAAGGGKDGIDAMNKMTDKLSEQDRRASSKNILADSFPNATPEEMTQLTSVMDAADNTEAGLTRAREVRADQRRVKKGKQFQSRAVSLLNKIIANPQLPDVLGSIEGAIDMRLLSDKEAELIADIEEAGSILTADNLDLMSGVLSESDIALLKNLASGGLNRKRTEDRFISDVQAMIDRLSTGEGQPEGDTGQVGRFTVRVK
tara:strand:+ start:31606 stop:32991 length:1386 start_codon:yes stop_codon:yes gene_type:complete